MYLVQILLPRADNSGNPFQRQEYDEVKEELAHAFEGVTAYLRAPAEGLWKQGVRWCRFLRQGHKVDFPMTRTIQHEDTQTVLGRFQGQGRA